MLPKVKKNSLRIHKENIKENHNCVVSLYVIKTHLLFSSIFLGFENINFQNFFVNGHVKGLVFYPVQNFYRHILYLIKYSCSFFKHYLKQSVVRTCLCSKEQNFLINYQQI